MSAARRGCETRWRWHSHPSASRAPVPVGVSRGCLRAPALKENPRGKGNFVQLPQSSGAAAGAGGCCHPSLASVRATTPPRNGTRPGMLCYRPSGCCAIDLRDACLVLPPLPLSQCLPVSPQGCWQLAQLWDLAATWHKLRQRETLAAAGGLPCP